ncbi:hypothetical protein DIS24_g7154 [Lasiodiplodia hormozganensis]|uniref:Uncharacterized protein n=1 Tax=Lasiodiplodia hormozganensis TaxID=869390 RepID=A0AA40CUY8_9PEZI|nr:hypothetical protein DIS24_g7154 [Lasiodiplodia hormozganensis]
MAPKYTIQAINSLSEVEKLRLVLAYLHHNEPKNVDWAAAAAQSGSKSKESFKVLFNGTLKKLEKQSSEGGADTNATSPAVRAPKRKADSNAPDNDKPTPKKRGRKKAIPEEPVIKEDPDVDDEVKDAAQFATESFFDTAEEF